MFEIQHQQELSAEVEQTYNPDRTDSENSSDDQEKPKLTKLGLVNERPEVENQEKDVKGEEEEEKPGEQEANNEQP